MDMGSTPSVTEISTRHISSGVKTAAAGGLATLPFSCAYFLEICESLLPEILRACTLLHLFCLRDKRPAVARTVAHPRPLFCLL